MKIPVNTSLYIEEFSGGSITVASAYVKNGVFDKYPNETWFVTQRPGINVFVDASDDVAKVKGRGIYYWDIVSASYIVNDDTAYKTNYGTALTNTLTSGTDRVYFAECGPYLVIIDPQGNKGYVVSSGATTTLTEITDTDFPPKQTSPMTLAKGCATLDGTLYVMDVLGNIYGSDIETPTAWNGLNVINAEAETDGGVYIGKHKDHIVAFGQRSCQFFYDAANAVGSPLSVRKDIYHTIGMADLDSAWADSDTMFFVGMTPSGGLGVFKLENFAIKKVSTPSIDAYLTTSIISGGLSAFGTGFFVGGKAIYLLTIYALAGSAYPKVTLAYEAITDTWGLWELAVTGISHAPLVSWTQATSTRIGEGILSNGDLVNATDNKIPQDTVEGSSYIESGYVNTGYFSTTEGAGTNFTLEVVTGQHDAQTRNRKFMSGCRFVGTPTNNTSTFTVQWTDNSNSNYNAGQTLDISNPANRINRMGSFRQRNFKLSYSGSEFIEIEGLEANIAAGSN